MRKEKLKGFLAKILLLMGGSALLCQRNDFCLFVLLLSSSLSFFIMVNQTTRSDLRDNKNEIHVLIASKAKKKLDEKKKKMSNKIKKNQTIKTFAIFDSGKDSHTFSVFGYTKIRISHTFFIFSNPSPKKLKGYSNHLFQTCDIMPVAATFYSHCAQDRTPPTFVHVSPDVQIDYNKQSDLCFSLLSFFLSFFLSFWVGKGEMRRESRWEEGVAVVEEEGVEREERGEQRKI